MYSYSSIISLSAFIAAILLTFKRPRVRLPFVKVFIQLDYGLAPILCLAVLLATSIIDVNFVINGILGCENIRPYSIIILILALSYICTSLDLTGFFEYIALKVIKRAGSSGGKLFVYLFLLTSFLTLFHKQ
jgi:Na+/H+ antiporter NhaD/arsenite permease-like protein